MGTRRLHPGAALALGAVLACASLARAASVRTDRGVYPAPEGVRAPKAGGRYVDPTFGTEILRVTDERDGKDSHNAYSYWPAFNRDSTRFHISASGRPTLYGFDPEAFKITGKEALFAKRTPGNSAPGWEDCIWSGVDRNAIFGHEGPRLWRYDVAAKEYLLLRDFTKELPAGGYLGQMSKSLNDMVFAFTIKDRKYKSKGIFAWRRDTDKVLVKRELPGLDEAQVDKSGRFCIIKTGRQGKGAIEVQVADLMTGKIEDLTDNAPDFAPGHSDNGHGVVIGADNWRNRITFRHLARPHEVHTVLDFRNDWSQGLHVSLLADDEDWALVSLYKGNRQKSSGVFLNELVLAATDGTQRVRRLAHHRSAFKSYWDSPRACISRDGSFVLYTSNFNGAGRRDVFILKVPPAEGRP